MRIAPEHIPSIDKVNAYLALRAQGDLCEDVLDCQTWPAEAFLMDDLTAHLHHTNPLPKASLADIRLYLRAISWFQYPACSDSELLTLIHTQTAFTSQEKALFSQIFSQDQKEQDVEQAVGRLDTLFLLAWQELQKARRAHDLPWRAISHDALPSDLIEAKGAVEALRPLRDALYFRRHLSHWLGWNIQ